MRMSFCVIDTLVQSLAVFRSGSQISASRMGSFIGSLLIPKTYGLVKKSSLYLDLPRRDLDTKPRLDTAAVPTFLSRVVQGTN